MPTNKPSPSHHPSKISLIYTHQHPPTDETLFSPPTLGARLCRLPRSEQTLSKLGPTIHQARRPEEMVATGLLRDPSGAGWQTYRLNPPKPPYTRETHVTRWTTIYPRLDLDWQ